MSLYFWGIPDFQFISCYHLLFLMLSVYRPAGVLYYCTFAPSCFKQGLSHARVITNVVTVRKRNLLMICDANIGLEPAYHPGRRNENTLVIRPVTSLGHQVGRRVFWKGPTFFKLCLIFSNYVQHIFPGGAKKLSGGFAPLRPPWLRVCL